MEWKLHTAARKKYETSKNNVCLLNTALYGLVQSVYLWFEEIKGYFLHMG